LTLRVKYQALRPLTDVEFGISVCRSTDGYEVYHANFDTIELGAPSAGLIGVFTVTFAFKAHLVRGPFFVGVHAFQPGTHSYLNRITPAAHFVVDETRSRTGLADLSLSAELAVSATSTTSPAAVAAEARAESRNSDRGR
jgi:hypothetical protein